MQALFPGLGFALFLVVLDPEQFKSMLYFEVPALLVFGTFLTIYFNMTKKED